MVHSKRRFPSLTGTVNFRDMGGYPTENGCYTRWRTLFRSGSTHALTAEDIEVLAALGIRFVYDLRSNGERLEQPSPLVAMREVHYDFLNHDRLPGNVRKTLTQQGAGSAESTAMMIAMYRQLPFEFRDGYRALFKLLENTKLPLLFNCTVGKDRTGVAAALLLTALGVPRHVILEDYLATELFFERSCEVVLSGHLAPLLAGIGRDLWEPMMRANPMYLEAMFEQVEMSCGSTFRYLQQELGISPQALEKIRVNLLEQV